MARPFKNVEWPPDVPRGFPLTVVSRGYIKRINGKPQWIAGKVPPDEALKAYHAKAGALLRGERPMPAPRPVTGIVTVHYILARWLQDRRADAERGALTPGSYMQYKLSGKRIDAAIGSVVVDEITPDHIKHLHARLAREHGQDFAGRAIAHFKACCSHAFDSGWCAMPRLGRRVTARLAARPRGRMKWKLWTPGQVKLILAALGFNIALADGRSRPSWLQLKAMVLLALNGGYGAMELSQLPRSAVDLAGRRIDHRRGKTGAQHVVPLWDETVEALKPVLEQRPGDELVFRTREGNPWCRSVGITDEGRLRKVSSADHVNERFSEVLKGLGLKTAGVGFYKCRHLFASTADKSLDRNAVSVLMGHSLGASRDHYIAVGEDRLRAVVDFVRQGLLVS